MAVITERVDRLEEALTKFMEQTSMILAANREDIAEIRASNARTDRQLLEMQQQAEKDRQQAEKERKEFNRQLAIESSFVAHLSRLHIYALGFGDETMEILNKDAF